MSSRLFCFAFKTYFFTSAGYVTNKQRQGSDYVKGKCHQATFWLQTSRNRPQTRDCPLDWARLTFPSSSPLRDLTDRECVYGGGGACRTKGARVHAALRNISAPGQLPPTLHRSASASTCTPPAHSNLSKSVLHKRD